MPRTPYSGLRIPNSMSIYRIIFQCLVFARRFDLISSFKGWREVYSVSKPYLARAWRRARSLDTHQSAATKFRRTQGPARARSRGLLNSHKAAWRHMGAAMLY